MGYVALGVEGPRDAGIYRSRRAREELAKAWLLDVLARTPLEEMVEVPLGWIAEEGPEIIGDIVRSLGEPSPSGSLQIPAEGIERISGLGTLRQGSSAHEIPRDLAALQTLLIEALLIEALRREVPERQLGAFAGSVGRLAEIFGDIQAQVGERLVRERSGGATVDALTGLPGQSELHEWLRILVADHRRYGHPFTVLLIEVDGLDRINQAHGADAGDRMLRAVAAILRRQVRTVDRLFRLDDDEFCVLAPDQVAEEGLPLAQRVCEVIHGSQGDEGPRLAVTAGLASCPQHGDDAESVMASAEEASWSAKAAGRPVAVGAP